MRVRELAKQLKLSSRALLETCDEVGVTGLQAASNLTPANIKAVMAAVRPETDPEEVSVQLLPSQLELLEAKEKEVLYSGAFGSGKTRGLCYKALQGGIVPGNRVGVCRKKFRDCKATTMEVMLRPEGELPAVLEGIPYDHNKTDHEIRIRGGGSIYYFGFDEETRIGSFNFGRVCIDEGIELVEIEYTMLLGRLRNIADPLRQIITVTNPGPPSHFLYQRFGIQADGASAKPDPNKRVMFAPSRSNVFLPKDYLELLDSFEGQAKERFVEGRWITMEGLVYHLDRPRHLISNPPDRHRRVVAGVDSGFASPSAITWLDIDGDGRVTIFKEYYQVGKLDSEVAAAAAAGPPTEVFIIDPSAPKLLQEFRLKGLTAFPGNNEIADGLQVVRDYLALDVAGRPKMQIASCCNSTITEFESYSLKPGTEIPEDKNNHSMDALRYALMYIVPQTEPRIRWISRQPVAKRAWAHSSLAGRKEIWV